MMADFALIIQLILLVSLPLTKCKASNPSPSLPDLGSDDESNDSSGYEGHREQYVRQQPGPSGLHGSRYGANQSCSSPHASSSAADSSACWEDSGGGGAQADLPHLEAFHEEESTSDEADKKPDVDTLQSKLERYEKKLDRRRLQNRLAARRSRQRKKDEGEYLTKKTQKLHTANTDLKYEIEVLAAEKDQLKKQLEEHLKVCQHSHRLGHSQLLPCSSPVAGAGPAGASVAVLNASTAASASNFAVPMQNFGQIQQSYGPVNTLPSTVLSGSIPEIVTVQTGISGAGQLPSSYSGSVPLQTLHLLPSHTNQSQTAYVQQLTLPLSSIPQQGGEQIPSAYTASTPGQGSGQPTILAPQSPTMNSEFLPLVLSDFDDSVLPHASQGS